MSYDHHCQWCHTEIDFGTGYCGDNCKQLHEGYMKSVFERMMSAPVKKNESYAEKYEAVKRTEGFVILHPENDNLRIIEWKPFPKFTPTDRPPRLVTVIEGSELVCRMTGADWTIWNKDVIAFAELPAPYKP